MAEGGEAVQDIEVAEASTETTGASLIRSAHERPLYKLTVRLIDTYKLINKVYYENKARKTTHSSATGEARERFVVHAQRRCCKIADRRRFFAAWPAHLQAGRACIG